jgi:hypothetical protein
MKRSKRLERLRRPESWLDHIRQFLSPRAWKPARHAAPRRRDPSRWDLQPLVLILRAMTGAAGDSQPERFEMARGFYVASYRARRRPGKTLQGFQKALARLPMRPLRALAAGVRHEIRRRYAERLTVDGFEPMGCDGSRIECPRAAELEARLRAAGKDDSAPTLWVTAFVHLGTGLLWSWQLGPGTADERAHLRRLLGTLSPEALVVADAAYMGYELAMAIVAGGRSFLLRVSSKTYRYTAGGAELASWSEGPVSYWPVKVREAGRPPLACRLIRVPARGRAKHDVWLLTDVLDPRRLPAATAARFYRWRWKNEGIFRTYKRTVSEFKLWSRTVRLARREAEVSLLATQLLRAHADLALRPAGSQGRPAISPRKVLVAIRGEMRGVAEGKRANYRRRLEGCRAEAREQRSAKASREWPRRQPQKPPGPPVLQPLTEELKALMREHLYAA